MIAAGVQTKAELEEEQQELKRHIRFFQSEMQLRRAVVEQQKQRFSQKLPRFQLPHAQDALLTEQLRLSRNMEQQWTRLVEQLEEKLQQPVQSPAARSHQQAAAATGQEEHTCQEAAGHDALLHTQVRQQMIVLPCVTMWCAFREVAQFEDSSLT